MGRLFHSLTVYFAYFVQFLKARMSYRLDFAASMLAHALVTISGLLFIVFLINGNSIQSLKGWSKEEVLFIYGYSMVAMAIFSTLAYNLYGFANKYIIEGQFDRVLLRPLNTLFQVIFESFNLDAWGSLLTGLAVLAWSANELGIAFGLVDYVWLILSSISGGIILLSVFVLLASVSFHFEDRVGIAPPFYNLIAFGRYPLPIFNDLIQFILRWIVPFAFVAFYPATHFLNRSEFQVLCYFTPVMAVICAGIAGAGWKFGVGRYSSVGN